jgi:hypothetical protein
MMKRFNRIKFILLGSMKNEKIFRIYPLLIGVHKAPKDLICIIHTNKDGTANK